MSIIYNIKPKIEESWSILKIVQENVPTNWDNVFKNSIAELEHISKKLDDDHIFGDYLPRKEDIFNAFKFTNLNDVKVIILNDEPYNTYTTINNKKLPVDIGLAYSTRRNDKITPVVNNIYKELKNEYPDYTIPNHGDLTYWCQQGVLLLNISLTTSIKHSHLSWELWHGFLNKLFKSISVVNPYTIVLLWGKECQKMSSMLPDNFIIFETSSPKGYGVNYGFFGCNHFKLTNEKLIKLGKTPIDWQIK